MMKVMRLASVAAVAGLAINAGSVVPLRSAIAAPADPLARATVDRAAAILVWPRVVVDTSGRWGAPTNTLIQLSNTTSGASGGSKLAHCYYINATRHCVLNPGVSCQSASDCTAAGGGGCASGWEATDFDVILTKDQPLGWYASDGLSRSEFPLTGGGVCNSPVGFPCTKDSDCAFPGGICTIGDNNSGSSIPPVPEDPFVGALRCIEYDLSKNPAIPDQSATTNTLKGEGTILRNTAPVAVEKYNAIGLEARGVAVSPANVLKMGSKDSGAQYAACPSTLILDHLFDGAVDPLSVGPGLNAAPGPVWTQLTLIPCGDNYRDRDPGDATAQMLVFNEFEQRLSFSRKVDCWYSSALSRIDTSTPTRSIFNASVAGTIAGQTRIKGVGSAPTGRGLVGVANLYKGALGTQTFGAAYNLNQEGFPAASIQQDVITLP